MFQSFSVSTRPAEGPPRLHALRQAMGVAKVDAFIVPRADAYQGEYVAACDARLAWLTGFTGSAGFAAVTQDIAGVFIDGRYRLQVKDQVAEDFTPVHWPETKLGPWLVENLPEKAVVAFDPWLHTTDEIETLRKAAPQLEFTAVENLVDQIWDDRPLPPMAPARAHPIEHSGEKSGSKRERMAKVLSDADQSAVVLTLPDSICWMLNIRGSDIERNPIVQCFAILHSDATVQLFANPEKFSPLGPDPHITVAPQSDFEAALSALKGPVRVDRKSAPFAVATILKDAEISIAWGDDPCALPKACKNDVEIAGSREAHLRDGAAMVAFLAWFDSAASSGTLSEIDAVKALEGFRRDTNALLDISFETISGTGPNGAIVHYRVSEETNRTIAPGDLYLVDSGGQYVDGTTDITRTIAVGDPTQEQCECFTRVLQGMIAISTARFPRTLAGRDLDALARAPLWRAGLDYDHGTGHGVGSYLSVHEGPQRLSRTSHEVLREGMILSNEPGYYRAGAFGIRIENLIVVKAAEKLGDKRDHLDFETLTFAPIDRRLISTQMLAKWERDWLNAYHAQVYSKLAPRVAEGALTWLKDATQPL